MTNSVLTGRVIRYDQARGYGFVEADSGDEDFFLHVNDVSFDERLLIAGARVRFIAEQGKRGLKASQVQLVGEGVASAAPIPADGAGLSAAEEGELCDVLATTDLVVELTEKLVTSVPTITAEQITQVRQSVVAIARAHGWIED